MQGQTIVIGRDSFSIRNSIFNNSEEKPNGSQVINNSTNLQTPSESRGNALLKYTASPTQEEDALYVHKQNDLKEEPCKKAGDTTVRDMDLD